MEECWCFTYCPLPAPVNIYVVDHGIEALGYPVVLIFWEYDVAAVSTFGECMGNVGDVILLTSLGVHDARFSPVMVLLVHPGVGQYRRQYDGKRKTTHFGSPRRSWF